tara:strand:+ start:455 stop:565 length:111 start_codon:yes stop_codon:yes gene_type:complete
MGDGYRNHLEHIVIIGLLGIIIYGGIINNNMLKGRK